MDMERWLRINGRGVAPAILAKTHHAPESTDVPCLGGLVLSDS